MLLPRRQILHPVARQQPPCPNPVCGWRVLGNVLLALPRKPVPRSRHPAGHSLLWVWPSLLPSEEAARSCDLCSVGQQPPLPEGNTGCF